MNLKLGLFYTVFIFFSELVFWATYRLIDFENMSFCKLLVARRAMFHFICVLAISVRTLIDEAYNYTATVYSLLRDPHLPAHFPTQGF